jgi:hypothetical protein
MPADCARHFDQIGFAVLLVAGAVCAGAFTTVASFHARQDALLPDWLTTTRLRRRGVATRRWTVLPGPTLCASGCK